MQSRSSDTVVKCCAADTMSSDSDLVDITSVNVHREMRDHCAESPLNDDLADEYVYDEDDDDDDDNDSDIPFTNGVDDTESQPSVRKPTVPVADGKLSQPPFGFPLRSPTEVMSHAMELLNNSVKPELEDHGGNNNLQHDVAEGYKHAVNSVCHCGDGDGIVHNAETAETVGKVIH